MTINEAQARIKARVWRALAQTELDFSSVDKETMESLVDLVTESALLEIDEEMGAALSEQQTADAAQKVQDKKDEDEFGEEVLWEGRPFLSPVLYYTVTSERIKISSGLLGKTHENVELVRVQDIDHSQTFGERLLKIGDITIRSHDPSHPVVTLKNIQDPENLHEILRRAVLQARKKHNFSYREEM